MHISALPHSRKPDLHRWARPLGLFAAALATFAAPMATAADDIAALTISAPHVKDNLAVYFIHGPSSKGPVPLTLAEAMRQNSVTVHETGRVQQLLIENTGDREVFVQAGDIVKGGRQDRVLTISLLIPPKSGKISIGSYCVEQGRWSRRGSESAKRFASAEAVIPSKAAKIAMLSEKPRAAPLDQRLSESLVGRPMPPGNRLSADRNVQQLEQRRLYRQRLIPEQRHREESRQQEVWRNVAEIQRKLSSNLAAGIRSEMSASSLQLSLEHQKLVEARETMAAALLPLGAKRRDVIGYAFVINGRINSAEIYPSNGLFRKMWPKLIKASVTEAIAEKDAKGVADKVPEPPAIRAFLEAASKGGAETTRLQAKLKRERRQSDKALWLATRRADGSYVHRSMIAY